MPVPEIGHRRSFVSELKFGTQKPRKRAIGCGFIRIRSKVFPLDGWAGWTRTIGMPQSKCGALPLGDIPKWGGRWDSNPRQPEPQSGALPTELRPPYMVHHQGIEPGTP